MTTPAANAVGADPWFDRPIFIISPPRSGSTLLFETLSKAPGVYTIGGESHGLFERIPALNIRNRSFESNRLLAQDATPEVSERLRRGFRDKLIDRAGERPALRAGRLRLLEKTPKNSLRIPFLTRVFPEARFVYLYRDPRQALASMIEAWNSNRFRTYVDLPGWPRPHWSLLLVPGWRALAGKELGEIVATQWETATRVLLDDLEALPRERWCVARYDALVADPDAEIRRLCAALDLAWDRPLDGTLPLSRYTVSKPDPDKWRRHAEAIEPQLPRLAATLERATRIAAA